jgi:hypothetical protein
MKACFPGIMQLTQEPRIENLSALPSSARSPNLISSCWKISLRMPESQRMRASDDGSARIQASLGVVTLWHVTVLGGGFWDKFPATVDKDTLIQHIEHHAF